MIIILREILRLWCFKMRDLDIVVLKILWVLEVDQKTEDRRNKRMGKLDMTDYRVHMQIFENRRI